MSIDYQALMCCEDAVDFVQFIPERFEKGFAQMEGSLRHTLHIASGHYPGRHASKPGRSRSLPCPWGLRRDDYHAHNQSCDRDEAIFRDAAAKTVKFLLKRSYEAWSELWPGEIEDVLGVDSELYLADYWTLTLHHLIWSRKLPWEMRADWIEGTSIDDEVFYFESELPVDLATASIDALVLFEEAVKKAVVAGDTTITGPIMVDQVPPISGPPAYQNGHWQKVYRCESKRRKPMETNVAETSDKEVSEIVGEEDEVEDLEQEADEDEHKPLRKKDVEFDDHVETEDSEQRGLELDDQSFTVHFGDASYQFVGRNKQLFALLERINRRPGMRVTFDQLRSVNDVWDGSPVEDSTVRGAVARLRKVLRQNEMDDLADRISTGTYQGDGYVMLKAGNV